MIKKDKVFTVKSLYFSDRKLLRVERENNYGARWEESGRFTMENKLRLILEDGICDLRTTVGLGVE